MPLSNNPKINNMIENHIGNLENQAKQPRDMSVEDGPHSRLSELNRVQNN
jgi:hypothetical protein